MKKYVEGKYTEWWEGVRTNYKKRKIKYVYTQGGVEMIVTPREKNILQGFWIFGALFERRYSNSYSKENESTG